LSKLTHGSVARRYSALPPEQAEKGGYRRVHVAPPFVENAAPVLWAAPSFQRSCWNTPMTFDGFVGLTATNGSSSVFG
jgi:hypothetical protein